MKYDMYIVHSCVLAPRAHAVTLTTIRKTSRARLRQVYHYTSWLPQIQPLDGKCHIWVFIHLGSKRKDERCQVLARVLLTTNRAAVI